MKPLGLFEGFGIEIELMIVDGKTLSVLPIAEKILTNAQGIVEDEMPLGKVLASNELSAHVIEFKTPGPAKNFHGMAEAFRTAVDIALEKLCPLGAKLLGTGMHPFMDPFREAVLWPYGQKEIYNAYNRIFDCRGHGWVNLQSVHLNLPFNDAESFGRLHSAVRCVLPLIPALSASTPVMDGKLTEFCDTRLSVYRNNQKRIPEIAGRIIPEPVLTPREYEEVIFQPMYRAIAPHDPEKILQEEWLNSRGAIARFDRSAIEIRLVDTQECVEADIAVIALVAAAVRGFVEERLAPFSAQKAFSTRSLAGLLDRCIQSGETAVLEGEEFSAIYGGFCGKTAGEVWKGWYENLLDFCPELPPVAPVLERILSAGTLSARIGKALGNNPDRERIFSLYRALGSHVETGKVFMAG